MPIRPTAKTGAVAGAVIGMLLGFFLWLVAAGIAWHSRGPGFDSLLKVLAISAVIGAAIGGAVGAIIAVVILAFKEKGPEEPDS
jgi:hypothetical protein